jgi:hypothetical protein
MSLGSSGQQAARAGIVHYLVRFQGLLGMSMKTAVFHVSTYVRNMYSQNYASIGVLNAGLQDTNQVQ